MSSENELTKRMSKCNERLQLLTITVAALLSPASGLVLNRNASGVNTTLSLCSSFSNPDMPPSFCYASPWMQELHQVDPAPNKVFVDVGCNTGVSAAKWLDVWEMSGLVERWRLALLGKVGPGACWQNKVQNIAYASNFHRPSSTRAKALCIEAMSSSVQLLHLTNTLVLGTSSPIEVIHAAASDREGRIFFPDNAAGEERRGINNFMQKETESSFITMTTVDKLVASRGISRVDVLTVDTEGHDPAVLRGAKQTLLNTRFLQFEVHEDFSATEWGKTTLLNVLNELSSASFDCYWPSNSGGLYKLTGCWTSVHQVQHQPIGWSNVVCAKRGDKWNAVLAKHAT